MKKFFVLYKASPEQFKRWGGMSPEEQKKGMEMWNKWMADHKDVIVDGGPLNKVKQVTKEGITDAHNDIGAYSIVKAESLEAAAEIFKDSPHFHRSTGTIEVMDMPEWTKK